MHEAEAQAVTDDPKNGITFKVHSTIARVHDAAGRDIVAHVELDTDSGYWSWSVEVDGETEHWEGPDAQLGQLWLAEDRAATAMLLCVRD